jgi:hypothetical protein
MTNGVDSATEIVQLAEDIPETKAEQDVEPVDKTRPEPENDQEQMADRHQDTEPHDTSSRPDSIVDGRPVSSAASETSENPNGFSTPQTSSAPLSPEMDDVQPGQQSRVDGSEQSAADEAQPADADVSQTAEADNSIDLSSPRASISNDTPAETVLPPTPTRPARRAVPVPPAAPAIPERSRARPASLTLSPRPDASTTAETLPITPDPSTAVPVVTPMPVRPPALPARTEKRVSIVHEKEDPEEVDSWESKTWKEVVRLKEEMWRARVGVTEEST